MAPYRCRSLRGSCGAEWMEEGGVAVVTDMLFPWIACLRVGRRKGYDRSTDSSVVTVEIFGCASALDLFQRDVVRRSTTQATIIVAECRSETTLGSNTEQINMPALRQHQSHGATLAHREPTAHSSSKCGHRWSRAGGTCAATERNRCHPHSREEAPSGGISLKWLGNVERSAGAIASALRDGETVDVISPQRYGLLRVVV